MISSSPTCSTCAIWFQKPDDKMTALGYGRCPHLPVGQYLAAAAFCRVPNAFRPHLNPLPQAGEEAMVKGACSDLAKP